ncbi:MAG: hypothetical protein ACE5IO_01360 [Thermoplasmata archaeon]
MDKEITRLDPPRSSLKRLENGKTASSVPDVISPLSGGQKVGEIPFKWYFAPTEHPLIFEAMRTAW